jgi:PAS domain S-box-containing protein
MREAFMLLNTKAYITFIIALGVGAVVRGWILWDAGDLLGFACYLALALPASCLKVRFPGATGTMSVLFLFLLAGVVELGVSKTLIIGAACVLLQCYWRPAVKPRLIQALFSVATICIAISASDLCYRWERLPFAHLQPVFRLALSATTFFLFNTFPVAAVIALTERKSLRQVWLDFYSWSFPYYLVGAAVVGMFGVANRLDWQAWVMILPLVYVMYRSYHLYLDRLEYQLKQAEEERRHGEEVADLLAQAVAANARLDAVIQASPLAILALDAGGNVKSWNPMAERIFGWSAEEVVGKPLACCGECSSVAISSIVDQTLRGDPVSGLEMTQLRKDRSRFEAEIWTAALRDGIDPAGGILLTAADVSDRKRLEEQLRSSMQMEALGRLAGGIAHDFNNLLTIINGYSAMLMDVLKSDSYALSHAEEILNAGNRASNLVAQLLSFSRRQIIKPAPLEVNQLVADVERMLSRLIGEHIDFQTTLDPDAGWILADHSQMTAVLMNLVSNARDAMPQGGILTIATSRVGAGRQQPPRMHLSADSGDYVRLTITDTGHGMDAATRQHIFEPFFTTKEKGKGTGLGLCSVYGSIQQNGGRIFVDTEVGVGTTFSIYLPAHAHSRSPETRVVERRIVRSGTETILLVEDEAALRRMVREGLEKAGYRVWEAGNGVEALQQWETSRGRIDLLVSDVVMPLMNGLKLAQELAKRAPGLPVIFMSGHAEDVITRQGVLDAGLELLTKPFLPDVLVQRVREVLDQQDVAAGEIVRSS